MEKSNRLDLHYGLKIQAIVYYGRIELALFPSCHP
jgi:hypothetical protein